MNRLMKHTGVSLLLISFFLGSCASTYAPAYNDQYDQYGGSGPQVQVSGSISFYDELSPYGRWVSYPGYDQVWIPNAGRDFRPYYTNGHWVYTDYGWTWMSDYSWGWAAFHYGRWLYDDFQGWMWVPGNDWGPAWVSWRTGGDYYGWAPMGPQYSYNAPANYWAFVPRQYINSPRLNNYYVNNSRNVTIINNTTIINNYNNYRGNRVYTGPNASDVQRYSGQAVRPVRVENMNRPGAGRVDNNRLQIYRPDAAAIQRGREADRTRPVQPVDNRPNRVTPGNAGNVPNNNGGRVNPGQPVNNGNVPVNNNNGGRVTPGNVTQPANNNTPGNINRPSRITPDRTSDQQQQQQQQQRIQQQQQQRVQQQQQQQQQRIQQQQQQQQRVQQQQQEQQRVQRVQQQQQQQQQRIQQQQQQQRVQQQQQQQQRVQQQQQQQRAQQQQQQQQQRVQREQQQQQQQQQRQQQEQQRVQREQQQQQQRPQRQE